MRRQEEAKRAAAAERARKEAEAERAREAAIAEAERARNAAIAEAERAREAAAAKAERQAADAWRRREQAEAWRAWWEHQKERFWKCLECAGDACCACACAVAALAAGAAAIVAAVAGATDKYYYVLWPISLIVGVSLMIAGAAQTPPDIELFWAGFILVFVACCYAAVGLAKNYTPGKDGPKWVALTAAMTLFVLVGFGVMMSGVAPMGYQYYNDAAVKLWAGFSLLIFSLLVCCWGCFNVVTLAVE